MTTLRFAATVHSISEMLFSWKLVLPNLHRSRKYIFGVETVDDMSRKLAIIEETTRAIYVSCMFKVSWHILTYLLHFTVNDTAGIFNQTKLQYFQNATTGYGADTSTLRIATQSLYQVPKLVLKSARAWQIATHSAIVSGGYATLLCVAYVPSVYSG